METAKVTIEELFKHFGSLPVPYDLQLETVEWSETRNRIIQRDNGFCTKCGRGPTIAHSGRNSFFGYKLKTPIVSEDTTINSDEKELYGSDKYVHLEVHHKYYVAGKYAWQYPDNALITLCSGCHQEVHNTEHIPYYNSIGKALGYTPCGRCNGRGWLAEYKHVQGGKCFGCKGARYEELIRR